MRQMLFDKIREMMAEVLEGYGDEFDADIAFTLVPSPQGPMLGAIIVVSAKSLLLGGGMCVSSIFDPDPMSLIGDPARVNAVMVQAIAQVREMRSQQLSVGSGAVLGQG